MGGAALKRLLVANRGEIAVRIARGARELGISPVGVYSDADKRAMFRDVLDNDVRIGPAPARESYLDPQRILAAARSLGADAVHPGYGFLSENAQFAQAVADAGLIFVGPPPSAIAAMGSKIAAKRHVRACGVPVVPGYDGDDQSRLRLRAEAETIGVPVLIKASSGGGGRGMRVVEDLANFDEALAAAKREALAAFGDDSILLERYLHRPRHIEFQILADAFGSTVYVGERECSIQRRHQKILEEAPSVALDPALRASMGQSAVAAAKSVKYQNAGTAEFMLDEDGRYYFLEMNARLQVEHPVTEFVYGIDLVQQQLRIARGERLGFTQTDLVPRGWAIEARLNAEDPDHEFVPSTGTIVRFDVPAGPGVRVDTGVRVGSEITIDYDSMLAKIVVWGSDRAAAIARMDITLRDTRVSGTKTNLSLLRAIVANDAYRAGATTTRFLDEHAALLHSERSVSPDVAFLAAGALLADGRAWRIAGMGVPIDVVIEEMRWSNTFDRDAGGWRAHDESQTHVSVDRMKERTVVTFADRKIAGEVVLDRNGGHVTYAGRTYAFTHVAPPARAARHGIAAADSGTIVSPMPGKIVNVNVRTGDRVDSRTLLVVLEAMKMEHRVEAPFAGTVEAIGVSSGQLVAAGATLITIRA